jgi:hypothetical protein
MGVTKPLDAEDSGFLIGLAVLWHHRASGKSTIGNQQSSLVNAPAGRERAQARTLV